jgi:hypothetical protein
MSNFLRFFYVAVIAVVLMPVEGRAQCDIRSFIVNDITSIQQHEETALAFALSATQNEYENAQKDFSHAGSWAGGYGLFDDKGTYSQAQARAQQIAQAVHFDYSKSYASNYLNQHPSQEALDKYVECLHSKSPGLRIWFDSQDGDFFKYKAFWIGRDLGQGVGHLEKRTPMMASRA